MTKANSGTATVTLPADTEIVITREFAAPRQLLYRAWTTPDLVRRWWSGHRGQVTSIRTDLRVGGAWRYVMRGNDGFHGEYREIVPGERIVYTEVFEGRAGCAGAEHRDVRRGRRAHDRGDPRAVRQAAGPRHAPGQASPSASVLHAGRIGVARATASMTRMPGSRP